MYKAFDGRRCAEAGGCGAGPGADDERRPCQVPSPNRIKT